MTFQKQQSREIEQIICTQKLWKKEWTQNLGQPFKVCSGQSPNHSHLVSLYRDSKTVCGGSCP